MIKRIFDLMIVLFFSPLILFLLVIISLYLMMTISSPIFFVQTRAGKNGKPFRLYKFRTMANKINQKKDNFESERKRVLKSTYFLRLLKFDEIPQFFNIIKGFNNKKKIIFFFKIS